MSLMARHLVPLPTGWKSFTCVPAAGGKSRRCNDGQAFCQKAARSIPAEESGTSQQRSGPSARFLAARLQRHNELAGIHGRRNDPEKDHLAILEPFCRNMGIQIHKLEGMEA